MAQFGRLPPQFANAPDLWPGLEFYWSAFWALDSCRAMGMSVGPIPWTAIEQWCDAKEVDDEERETVHYLIRRMDIAYLAHHSAKMKK